MMQNLMQMFGGQGVEGILGQEIAAQAAGGKGFMGQADLHPQVGAPKQAPQMGGLDGALKLMQNPAFQQQMGVATGQQQQQQQMPPPMPMPQSRAPTMQMPQQSPLMAQMGQMPSAGVGFLGRYGR